jgi:hypothetical protein
LKASQKNAIQNIDECFSRRGSEERQILWIMMLKKKFLKLNKEEDSVK